MAAHSPTPLILGIEGGGTKTVAVLARGIAKEISRVELGPANQRLMSDAQLLEQFQKIANSFPRPDALGICLAGGWEERDWARLRAAAAQVWPGTPCRAGNDLHSAILAAPDDAQSWDAKVLVLSGTGSCCFGTAPDGRTAKVGGWGHVLGDQASGYDIALKTLQLVAAASDRAGSWSGLGRRLLRKLHLNSANELIDWAHAADKPAIAALAPEIFAGDSQRDPIARQVLSDAAARLAEDAVICAAKLARHGTPVQFIFAGSILLKQPRFADSVARNLRRLWHPMGVVPLRRESVWGAVKLAASQPLPLRSAAAALASRRSQSQNPKPPRAFSAGKKKSLLPESTALSPTERRNPASTCLDRMSLDRAIRLMLVEESQIHRRLLAHRPAIKRIIPLIARALRRGGRVFYVGAGTSGRLGLLDASECPPTFGTRPEQVQAIIAGGQTAISSSVEGAEDDSAAGEQAISLHHINEKDFVIGLSASGTTPFVWGALKNARRRHATTALICFNPHLKIPAELHPGILLACNVGPEVLTGSTRLKAGTATKLLLNIFSTLAMVQTGKVVSNLMVDVNPANEKLRARATRIVRELTGVNETRAAQALASSHWNVKRALSFLGWSRSKTAAKATRHRA